MAKRVSRAWRSVLVGVAISMLVIIPFPSIAVADPKYPVSRFFPNAVAAPDGSRIVSVVRIKTRQFVLEVYSAAMNRKVGLQVIRPADSALPAPVLYLLNGAEDGRSVNDQVSDGNVKTWQSTTDVVQFMANKQVNVVTLMDGAYTYYADWVHDDPTLGRNRWTTFLTKELPPILNSAFTATGRNVIAGVSMSATSVLRLAESDPSLYRSVGSFSGCSDLDNQLCSAAVQAVLMLGRGVVSNMWGPVGSALWDSDNPGSAANLAKLRGINLFFASGNGMAGIHDTAASVGDDLDQLGRQIILGGGPEALIAQSNMRVRARLNALGIPATFRFTKAGTHSWMYWQDDLHAAWPSFAASLGIPAGT